jgi:hypothetical protein
MSEEVYFNKRMVRLGEIFNSLSLWIWLSIFLFWLVFPVIVLVYFLIRLLIVMNDLRMIQEEDIHLERAIAFILISPFALLLTGIIFGYIYLRLAIIGLIVGIVLNYMAWKEVSLLSESLLRSMPPLQEFHDGIKMVKNGTILQLVVIGFFLIPIGYKKAGKQLIAVFGGGPITSTNPYQAPANVQTQGNPYQAMPNVQNPPNPYQTMPNPQNSPNPYGQTPSIGIATSRIGVSPNPSGNAVLTHCPKCGVQFPQPGIKFCGACGYRVN